MLDRKRSRQERDRRQHAALRIDPGRAAALEAVRPQRQPRRRERVTHLELPGQELVDDVAQQRVRIGSRQRCSTRDRRRQVVAGNEQSTGEQPGREEEQREADADAPPRRAAVVDRAGAPRRRGRPGGGRGRRGGPRSRGRSRQHRRERVQRRVPRLSPSKTWSRSRSWARTSARTSARSWLGLLHRAGARSRRRSTRTTTPTSSPDFRRPTRPCGAVVGHVPAGPLELERGRGDLLAQLAPALRDIPGEEDRRGVGSLPCSLRTARKRTRRWALVRRKEGRNESEV